MRLAHIKALCACLGIWVFAVGYMGPAMSTAPTELDGKARGFLLENRTEWRDSNVPYEEGKVLHDLILKNNYTRALEIGTSTGHSAIWIAWALSKTGGRLITIEIDEDRHGKALENFRKAGVDGLIDARLADAHQLVKELQGPFDFVFSDADKDWNTQYFKDLDAKLVNGGCFTAHDASRPLEGMKRFLDYVRSRPNYQTTIDQSGSAGISISYKQ